MAEFSLVWTQMRRIWDYSMGFMLDKQSNVGKTGKSDDELADHNRINTLHNSTQNKTKSEMEKQQNKTEMNLINFT